MYDSLSLTFCDVRTYLVTMSCSRPIGVILLNSFLFFHTSIAQFLVSLHSFRMTLSQGTISPHKSIVSGCPFSFLYADASVSATMYLYLHVCTCIIQLNYFFCLLVCICSNQLRHFCPPVCVYVHMSDQLCQPACLPACVCMCQSDTPPVCTFVCPHLRTRGPLIFIS